MSKTEKSKKIVRVNESALVDMIENIVSEAVAEKKKEWIVENEEKQTNLLEEQVKKIVDARLAKMVIKKKSK